MERASIVQKVQIHTISSSSMFQAGDTRFLTPFAKVIAVQKQVSSYNEDEHPFEKYAIFSKRLPLPDFEAIQVCTVNEGKAIHVNTINILGVAASSAVRIGNTDFITAESRVKHIRQFEVDPYE
ncbi:spore germination protein GerPE [Pseudalkalibacillus decolorationis]|uniref:spore germination protein GerPE n=1 Tax=Pseudalkalibacillus decolorationis TaxID=163879 RepID=UPI0021488914|nr:spore germination protein GerPE [Pseudalkalibacillus decolorationis]